MITIAIVSKDLHNYYLQAICLLVYFHLHTYLHILVRFIVNQCLDLIFNQSLQMTFLFEVVNLFMFNVILDILYFSTYHCFDMDHFHYLYVSVILDPWFSFIFLILPSTFAFLFNSSVAHIFKRLPLLHCLMFSLFSVLWVA